MTTAYLRAGLERGERVVYYADQRAPHEVLAWLISDGVDPGPALVGGQLLVTTAEDGYLPDGSFDADAMVGVLRDEVANALAAGFTGFRVSGDMTWALREPPGAGRLAEYETVVNEVFAGRPASAVCQYDVRRFTADQLRDFGGRHPGAVRLTPLHHDALLTLVPAFDDGCSTLRVVGTVDHRTLDHLVAALDVVSRRRADVVVDMSALAFLDLAGVRTLAHAARRLPEGRSMHVVDLPPLLCRVIKLAGFDEAPNLTVTAREVSA